MESVGGVGVIDKGAAILAAVAVEPLDLAGIQAVTGLPRATAHRLAVALEHHRLLRRDAIGRFCLGFELLRLGRLAAESFPLADLAQPVLSELRDSTGESVQLYVREGEARRCVTSLPSPHALRWTVAEGALMPLHLGSAGKVLIGEARLTESVEEREPGVASVSAAVCDTDGSVVAAVSISGPVERISRSPRVRFGSDVQAAAARLSALIPR
ncbi:MAG: IclR family transcriptional regulator [Ilumatobacteraceae bacterium]